MVGVVGEAGVGKSRLLHEFKKRIFHSEVTYLEGRCIHFGRTIPYLPVIGILKLYFEIQDGELEVVIRKRIASQLIDLDEKLEHILPALHDLLSLKVTDETYHTLNPKQKKTGSLKLFAT